MPPEMVGTEDVGGNWSLVNDYSCDSGEPLVSIYSAYLSQAGCNTRSILSGLKLGLTSEFSFFKCGCLPKLTNWVCPTIYLQK